MALIGTLREKLGAVLVGFIFVSLLAFILGDITANNSVLFNDNSVGEINGHEVSLEEFQAAVDERRANYVLNFGREPGEREMTALRQQAWDLLIARHAIQPEFAEVGVKVTDEELVDMISGNNIDPNIVQSFTNPETGQFDRAMLGTYLQQVRSMPPGSEQRIRWELFQRELKPGRERIKYENLILRTGYVTRAEAERAYHAQTDVAEIRFVYIPYYSVSDSVAEVSDADLKQYYNEHKERFKSEATRDVKYVVFPLIPSSEDSLYIRQDMERLAEGLKNAQNDSLYAFANSEGFEAFDTYNVSNLPEFIQPEDLTEGNIIGPFIDDETYKVAKVSAIFQDTIAYAQASHILIRWDEDTPAGRREARQKAEGILRDIRNGADFATQAREHGTDGTAANGGSLGWMYTGQMVKPFEDAVFSATRTGLINRLVETEFGYHIVQVDHVKDNTAYKIALIEREIGPSDATTNDVYRRAETFLADVSGVQRFETKAREENLNVFEGRNVTGSDRRIGTLGDARQIVQWLFRDAEVGEVSDIFDLPDAYVVAVMTSKTEQGYKPLEAVKNEILPEVRKRVKAQVIINKLGESSGSLDEIAGNYGPDAGVYSSSDLKLASNTLPSAGFDPIAVGVAFSLNDGERSKPVKGENGVLIIEMQHKTVAPDIGDYTAHQAGLSQERMQRSSFNIAEAIKEKADIKDYRYKFY